MRKLFFQFHKGAIETVDGGSNRSEDTNFQFHKGAIETHHRPNVGPYFSSFQFHKGAIETFHDAGISADQMAFNSIKVRLKHFYRWKEDEYTYFQFHKGAIETRPNPSDALVLQNFQFHKGAIETMVKLLQPLASICSFNSIKVRLKR